LGRSEEALADETAVIDLQPADIDLPAQAHWYRTLDLDSLGQTDGAVADLLIILELVPPNHEVHRKQPKHSPYSRNSDLSG
jgi:hypothetical protein